MTYYHFLPYFRLRFPRERWSAVTLNHLSDQVERNTRYLKRYVSCYYEVNGDMTVEPLDSIEVQNAKAYLQVMYDAHEFDMYIVERSEYDGSTRRTWP